MSVTYQEYIQYFVSNAYMEGDSLMVRALACYAADPGSNPAGGNDFFN